MSRSCVTFNEGHQIQRSSSTNSNLAYVDYLYLQVYIIHPDLAFSKPIKQKNCIFLHLLGEISVSMYLYKTASMGTHLNIFPETIPLHQCCVPSSSHAWWCLWGWHRTPGPPACPHWTPPAHHWLHCHCCDHHCCWYHLQCLLDAGQKAVASAALLLVYLVSFLSCKF